MPRWESSAPRKKLPSADHDRALDALSHPLGDLSRDAGDHIGVDADGASAEGLSGELQEDSTSVLSLRENRYR